MLEKMLQIRLMIGLFTITIIT